MPQKALTLNANDVDKPRRFSGSYGSRSNNRRFGRHGRQRSKSNVSEHLGSISNEITMVIRNEDEDDLSSSEEESDEEEPAEDIAPLTPTTSMIQAGTTKGNVTLDL